jgi:hypothetical protein
MLKLKFTQDDYNKAFKEWQCNCGPSALAACLGITLTDARRAITTFDDKHYTSPKMMSNALSNLNYKYKNEDDYPDRGLVRIQWHGPWLEEDPNSFRSKWRF